MIAELERLRELLRTIARQTDPTWSRELARREIALWAPPPPAIGGLERGRLPP